MRKLFFYFFLFTSSLPLVAQWNVNSNVNTPVSLSFLDQQEVRLISDSSGGAIVVWEDFRTNISFADIYAQRLNANGFPVWTTNGKGICTNILNQRNAAICPAPKGGAVVAWQDFRNSNWDIYAQKIDSSGNLKWTANGTPVCVKPLNQTEVKSVPDMSGGAYFVWVDSVLGFFDIYAQHLDSNGNQLWPAAGLPVCTSLDKQTNPRIELDGNGGCIITWMDKRFGDYDIYAQRIDAAGNLKWTTNGVLVVAYPLNQSNPKVDPDGTGGAIISWQDFRNNFDYDVYAQRIDSSGNIKWINTGVPICNVVGSSQSAVEICSKGGIGGAIIAWKDGRAGGGASQIFLQRINLAGQVMWQNNGILIGNGINPNLCEDGAGGVIVTWQDSTLGDWNVLTQRIDSSGNIIWPSGGVAVGDAAASQSSPKNVSDGAGGSIYAFQDKRNLVDFDVYAHHIFFYGSAVGINNPEFAPPMTGCFPNPARSGAKIYFNNSGWKSAVLLDVNGRMLQDEVSVSGNSLQLPVGLEGGIYFYRLKDQSGKITIGRLVVE
jgi:hypothetical protein